MPERALNFGNGPAGDEERGDAPVAVVVVTYNSAEVLPGLLDSLADGLAGISRFEVIVVDNRSEDRSAAIAEEHPIGARVIRSERNGGYAAGINLASRYIDVDAALLVLNPDIRLAPSSVYPLLKRLKDPAVGIAVPKIRGTDGRLAHSLRREPSLPRAWADAVLGVKLASRLGLGAAIGRASSYEAQRNVDWATGAALLISPNARRMAGAWDESFFLYSEEVDYQRRVREQSLSIDYVPAAEFLHIGGDYIANHKLSALLTLNQYLYYARTHGRVATVAFQLSLIVAGLLRMVRGPGHRSALCAAFDPTESRRRRLMNIEEAPQGFR